MALPKLIDNDRATLADVIRNEAPNHTKLSIATGYWDLLGTVEILNSIKNYESIRLIIGQEPMSARHQKELKLDRDNPESMFPGEDIKEDLVEESKTAEVQELRNAVVTLADLIKNGKLIVKVYRKKMLHAKAYIFGDYPDDNAIGIIGSSNFTKAGLTGNTELNSLNDDYQVVTYTPKANQDYGHLSWFDHIWNDDVAEDWTGDFRDILRDSPIGDFTFGPYDSYIKTLMEVYPDEMLPLKQLEKDTSDALYSFQNRNAGILINKLERMGVAVLADSVGLGKTITAGAVIKHYREIGKTNIQIIAPAALKQQWKDDLADVLGIYQREGSFNIVTEQDTNAIREIIEEYEKNWYRSKKIDLFVIDEAHNLRNGRGSHYEAVLDLLKQHPNSHVLLLTATPINNSLMDVANQIQLAAKGQLKSVNVSYSTPKGKRKLLDFFEALKLIQSEIKRAERHHEEIGPILDRAKPTIHEGLRYYLVRSTRQGVAAERSMIKPTGEEQVFPVSKVSSINYCYKEEIVSHVYDLIEKNIFNCFEGIDPRLLNLNLLSNFTQQNMHPLEFIGNYGDNEERICKQFRLGPTILASTGKIKLEAPLRGIVQNLLQVIFTLGFAPYRPEIYNNKYYGKTMEEINELNVPVSLRMQLSIHNIVQITWLKRMESSAAALLCSINNYKKRIDLFKKYLERGYIVTLSDANLLESDYNDGEDIERAFDDYDKYLKEREEQLDNGKDAIQLKKYGIERKVADPDIYNRKQINTDIDRDTKIIELLIRLLTEIKKPENDPKMHRLFEESTKVLNSGVYGKKLIVFSFFADTIDYLKENLSSYFGEDFLEKAEFISGKTNKIEQIVRRFSPKSKKYEIKENEKELDYLFSTDVLSEGQNLQDAGYLINYDLHWNPVRMIQRNGRINRLNSPYENVLISNMRPTNEMEEYLRLVHNLERKIETIRNTIGLDQGVLNSEDVNPIEFRDKYYDIDKFPDEDDLDDSLLAYTDKHILALREFLHKNKENISEINRVRNIPIGKWNYLPSNSDDYLALVKTHGVTSKSNKKIDNICFIKVECGPEEYVAEYVDYAEALKIIAATEDNNQRKIDNICVDRKKVFSRADGEARRQAKNPEVSDVLREPQYEKALVIMSSYFDPGIDLKGIIQKGVREANIKKKLELNLKKANNEQKYKGGPSASTIKDFQILINEIQKKVPEERIITETEGVLFYAGK